MTLRAASGGCKPTLSVCLGTSSSRRRCQTHTAGCAAGRPHVGVKGKNRLEKLCKKSVHAKKVCLQVAHLPRATKLQRRTERRASREAGDDFTSAALQKGSVNNSAKETLLISYLHVTRQRDPFNIHVAVQQVQLCFQRERHAEMESRRVTARFTLRQRFFFPPSVVCFNAFS